MQRGSILHRIMIITFCSVMFLLKLANIWKWCYTLVHWVTHWCHSVHKYRYTPVHRCCAFSVYQCVKAVSLHTPLCSCQILTMQTFYFHLWFSARRPPALAPLLLLSRHSGSLFSVLSGASAVVEWSWQRASSRRYLANGSSSLQAEMNAESLWGFF